MGRILQKELYGNYKMIHPNGDFMCNIDEKKVNWYITRNLAVWLSDDSIQLTFVPNGKGNGSSPYFRQSLKNHCVSCSATSGLTRHHVVPYVFRKHFPPQLKNHNHYDVLLLCHDCHEKYERFADAFKDQLCFEMTGYHIKDYQPKKFKETVEDRLIKKAQCFMNRLENDPSMTPPIEKIEIMREMASKPMSYVDVTNTFVYGCKWAEEMVKHLVTITECEEFSVKWRKHFLEYMKPQFMPDHWDINNG